MTDTDSDVRVEKWATPIGFSSYQASNGQPDGNGKVRSVDRTLGNGRRQPGQELSIGLSTRGYPKTTLRRDDGKPVTIEVHALQMLAFVGECPPGQQVRHYNDVPTDNRWAPGGAANCGHGKPGNLVHGTPKDQWDDKLRNVPTPLASSPSWSRRVADYAGSLLRRARSVTTGLSQGRRSL